RGCMDTRQISITRISGTAPARVIAVCHRSGELRWFRIDNFLEAKAGSDAYRRADEASVEALVRNSIGGFLGEPVAIECAFRVTDPDARWVAQNLLEPMCSEPIDGGFGSESRLGRC
ncbi:MAG: WYL domain-containing protein, partial [Bdellovibrionota bacterium]